MQCLLERNWENRQAFIQKSRNILEYTVNIKNVTMMQVIGDTSNSDDQKQLSFL